MTPPGSSGSFVNYTQTIPLAWSWKAKFSCTSRNSRKQPKRSVVPPSQAEAMVAALAARGLPHAYVPFEGEQHGFRRAQNQRTALEGELFFYARVFGFETDVAPAGVEIQGL